MSTPKAAADLSISTALRIANDGWEEVRRSLLVQQQLGAPLTRLPDLSPDEAERRSGVAKALVSRIEKLDVDSLPHDLALTLRLLRFRARSWMREADWYWTVVDPLGIGFFGLFTTTAYCGGFLLNFAHGQLAAFRFTEAGDLDRYLGLMADYERLLDQMSARTAGQAERGVRMPKPQIASARGLLGALRARCRVLLGVKAERVAHLAASGFLEELERRLAGIEAAFDRALAVFSPEYESKAPDGVGIGQYAGGREIYAELVKLHTTLDLTPEEVHARGHARMQTIQAQMSEIRSQVGFQGDAAAFIAHLNADPRWRAGTEEGVTAVFRRYIERMKPKFAEYFAIAPRAGHDVAPLAKALQASMTFGYYEPARPDRPTGLFMFNSANLTRQSLFNVGALTYHELVPGHHLHLATQSENENLHPLRTHSFVNAYNEGWAEYAATLAGEMGMYEQPEERYGRLVMDAFLTTRLVVDTGMNVLGWSLEKARDYMRANSGMTEAEVLSETLRYSCDIPAQALAYKLGDTEILTLRERMRGALGKRFDIREFHRAVLGPGALPMADLAWHVEAEIERLDA